MDKVWGWTSVACLFSVLGGWALGTWEGKPLTNETAVATLISAALGGVLIVIVALVSRRLNRRHPPHGGSRA
jgi:polyferredoxin